MPFRPTLHRYSMIGRFLGAGFTGNCAGFTSFLNLIFHYLPFRDQIRIGGVSVAFRRMSDIAISETKSLNLNDDALKNISPLCFSHLLNLCQGGLKKCNLVESPQGDCMAYYHLRMADAFNEYSYPQLNTLSFDSSYDSIISVSRRKDASNLESLSVEQINFPDVMMERLETLAIECDDHNVQTLAGKVPNLRRLIVTEKDNGLSTRALDSFLGTVPRLESFSIHRGFDAGTDDARSLDLEGNGMTNFWQLNLLNRFEVDGQLGVMIRDHALIRIAQCFPRLRVLSLYNVESGNEGVAALSSLQDLRVLQLKEHHENINAGLRELWKCERLEKLVVTYLGVDDLDCVSADTASSLLRSCPRLSFIACGELAGINTAGDAVAFITSLAVLEKRVIKLQRRRRMIQRSQIWERSEVKDALKKLDEETGVVVTI